MKTNTSFLNLQYNKAKMDLVRKYVASLDVFCMNRIRFNMDQWVLVEGV